MRRLTAPFHFVGDKRERERERETDISQRTETGTDHDRGKRSQIFQTNFQIPFFFTKTLDATLDGAVKY